MRSLKIIICLMLISIACFAISLPPIYTRQIDSTNINTDFINANNAYIEDLNANTVYVEDLNSNNFTSGTFQTNSFVTSNLTAQNANIGVDYGGTFKQVALFEEDYFTFFRGLKVLTTNDYLSVSSFPDNNNLFAWNVFPEASYSNTNTITGWDGGLNLIAQTTTEIETTTDHLGGDNALYLINSNTDWLYSEELGNNHNGSMFGWLWFRTDVAERTTYFFSHTTQGAGFNGMAILYDDSDLSLYLRNASATRIINSGIGWDEINDNNWHFVAGYFDENEPAGGIMFDGVIRGYDSNLNTSYVYANNNSRIYFGSTLGLQPRFDGLIADKGYKQSLVTPNELRKIYCRGSGDLCYEKVNGDINIEGKNKVKIVTKETVTLSDDTTSTTYGHYYPESLDYKIYGQMWCSFVGITENSGQYNTYFYLANDGELDGTRFEGINELWDGDSFRLWLNGERNLYRKTTDDRPRGVVRVNWGGSPSTNECTFLFRYLGN